MTRSLLVGLAVAATLGGGARMFAQDQTPPATDKPSPAPAAQAAPAAPGTQTGPAAPAVPPGNAEEGRKVYVSHGCYQCHGYEGQGSVAGPRLGPRPAPYPYFSSYIRKPALLMPPYTTKVLADADIANIYAFLQARPAPPPLDTIPLLK